MRGRHNAPGRQGRVEAALRRHGIDPSLPSVTTLANDLLIASDETHVEVWRTDDGDYETRFVDRVGATTRKGVADLKSLVDIKDQARRLRGALERLSDTRSRIVEMHLPTRMTEIRGTIESLERGLARAIVEMGSPPAKRKGNRVAEHVESSARIQAVLHATGVTDDWKCAGVIADLLTIVDRGTYSQDAIYKALDRLRKRGRK